MDNEEQEQKGTDADEEPIDNANDSLHFIDQQSMKLSET